MLNGVLVVTLPVRVPPPQFLAIRGKSSVESTGTVPKPSVGGSTQSLGSFVTVAVKFTVAVPPLDVTVAVPLVGPVVFGAVKRTVTV
jgi:hypothetical protein